ncbi:hypothetical protein [Actinokineospora bangkokensis]|uniref:Uncharacterized protein n=1 Tax=Actinokineospora bangkokensis TaxID=1193682 RepID=A0A1Q9LJA9_9PSEU|nr:hypothetical protein [Actinokineospora bangkokensis]OLR92090.1 hypothetical protein BJP25_22325 [Actinokineospora bangkokensis]
MTDRQEPLTRPLPAVVDPHEVDPPTVVLSPVDAPTTVLTPVEPPLAEQPRRGRRALRTAAGAAVVVSALWGLHDQFTPDHTAITADRSSAERAPEPTTAAPPPVAIAPPGSASAELIGTPAPPPPPPAPVTTAAPPPRTQAAPQREARQRSLDIPNPVEIVLDATRLLWGR